MALPLLTRRFGFLRWSALFALIFFVGGSAGVIFDRWLLPRMSALPWAERVPFLRNAVSQTTIINRTEEVVIREDDSVERVVSQPATAVVDFVPLGGTGQKQRSGVLLTNDGLAATYISGGVSQAAADMSALLFDGSAHPAHLAGFDRLTNLAYYRIDAANTPAIALANSQDAQVGRRLVAIGNTAAEYQNRLVVGLLGNIDRTFNLSGKSVASSEKWEGVFVMEGLMSEAFVGGPAIGYNGEMFGLVGMETLDGERYLFLLPSNVVRASLERLVAGTLEARPVLGAYYLSLTKAAAITQGLERDRGALIYAPAGRTSLALIAGSAAERAGLRYGDIITSVDGVEVNLDHPLSNLIGEKHVGDSLVLTVLRGGNELSIQVSL